jgi:hypothetical protein
MGMYDESGVLAMTLVADTDVLVDFRAARRALHTGASRRSPPC